MIDVVGIPLLFLTALLLMAGVIESLVFVRRRLRAWIDEVQGLLSSRQHFATVIREAFDVAQANRVRRRVERHERDRLLVEQLDRVARRDGDTA